MGGGFWAGSIVLNSWWGIKWRKGSSKCLRILWLPCLGSVCTPESKHALKTALSGPFWELSSPGWGHLTWSYRLAQVNLERTAMLFICTVVFMAQGSVLLAFSALYFAVHCCYLGLAVSWVPLQSFVCEFCILSLVIGSWTQWWSWARKQRDWDVGCAWLWKKAPQAVVYLLLPCADAQLLAERPTMSDSSAKWSCGTSMWGTWGLTRSQADFWQCFSALVCWGTVAPFLWILCVQMSS